jgi:hypothetical protein
VVFDSPNRRRAGAFTFRFWVNDVTPPRLALLTRTVSRGSPQLVVRATDGGSGVDPQSIVARVDGKEREAAFRDGTVRVDVGGLRPGRHALRLQVSDFQETRNTENNARILPNTRVLQATFVIAGP